MIYVLSSNNMTLNGCKINECEAHKILFLPLEQTLIKIARFTNKNKNNDHDFYFILVFEKTYICE